MLKKHWGKGNTPAPKIGQICIEDQITLTRNL